MSKSSDAKILSSLALKSKAYWPYDKDFVLACKDDLTITEERADSGNIFLAEANNMIVGFFGFDNDYSDPEMTHLFVSPEFIGKGMGKKIWNEALLFAQKKGWSSFKIIADPFAAENFYYHVGCKKIGEIESSVKPGRKLPLLKYELV